MPLNYLFFIIGLSLATLVRAWFAIRYRERKVQSNATAPFDRIALAITGVGMVAPFISLWTDWIAFADYGLGEWKVVPGGILFLSGIWMIYRSHKDLAFHWSPVLELQEGQELVSSGIYKRIRHPMYAGHLFWGLAQCILISNWVSGPMMLIGLVLLLMGRIKREEAMMLSAFGDEYEAYMAATGRFLPFL